MYISVSNHTGSPTFLIPLKKQINEQKDLFLCILLINKIYVYKRWKQQKYHTVTGCIYIYDMPVKDSKPKSKYPDEKRIDKSY